MIRLLRGSIALCRLNKPIGIYLIFWPALAAAMLTTDITNDFRVLIIIVLGSILVRSIGCVINDIFDKDFDAKVERTKLRPLASGALSKQEGWMIFALLSVCILVLIAFTNFQTILMGVIFGCLIVIYPLMKRIFLGPQLFLGMTFNPVFIVHSMTNGLSIASVILFIGVFAWVVAFDTYYGLSDIEDDKKLGINSTPLWWKEKTQKIIFTLQAVFLVCLYAIGRIYSFSNVWLLGLVLISLLFFLQYKLANNEEHLSAFKNNNFVGLLMCIFMFLETSYFA